MSDKTGIEWADATWNPTTGCEKVSPGCDNCYALTFAERWRGVPGHYFEHGFDVQLRPDKLDMPLRWRKPRRIFVNSMSDLFHKDIPNEYIARVFAVMAASPAHTFQVLTKRHGRMHSLLRHPNFEDAMYEEMLGFTAGTEMIEAHRVKWPLPNVWLGVSVENQHWADIRIPALLDTPAAVRFLSCEPLLGQVSLHRYVPNGWGEGARWNPRPSRTEHLQRPTVNWVIVGGESGHGARLMQLDWVRSLRDQCGEAGVAFHFKQFGEWAPTNIHSVGYVTDPRERQGEPFPDPQYPGADWRRLYRRVGKKAAGRELDGRTWDEFPAVAS